jgi:hypothetical protein
MIALVVAYSWYGVNIYRLADGVPVADVRYQPLVFIVVLPLLVIATIGHIFISALNPAEADTTDERDRDVARRGAVVGGWIVSLTGVAALLASMAEIEHFWIAHLLLLGLVVAELADGGRRLVLYRRGL